MRQEIPFSTAVVVEEFEQDDGLTRITALILVGRESHKGMVIGAGGRTLKAIGRAARLELKEHFGRPVHLELWVKVKEGWSDDENALRKFGYET